MCLQGADPNARDNIAGRTSLHAASAGGWTSMISTVSSCHGDTEIFLLVKTGILPFQKARKGLKHGLSNLKAGRIPVVLFLDERGVEAWIETLSGWYNFRACGCLEGRSRAIE